MTPTAAPPGASSSICLQPWGLGGSLTLDWLAPDVLRLRLARGPEPMASLNEKLGFTRPAAVARGVTLEQSTSGEAVRWTRGGLAVLPVGLTRGGAPLRLRVDPKRAWVDLWTGEALAPVAGEVALEAPEGIGLVWSR